LLLEIVLIFYRPVGVRIIAMELRSRIMKKILLVAIAPLALSACGHKIADRTLSGAGIGAASGAVLGPIGVGAGAVIGGAVGAVTPSKNVNLGKPVWNK
jgi:hypothetical protein